MPRLYMHIQSGNNYSEDIEGEEFFTLDDARQSALLDARDIMSEKVLKGHDPYQGKIVIADDAGGTLMVVPFKEAITES